MLLRAIGGNWITNEEGEHIFVKAKGFGFAVHGGKKQGAPPPTGKTEGEALAKLGALHVKVQQGVPNAEHHISEATTKGIDTAQKALHEGASNQDAHIAGFNAQIAHLHSVLLNQKGEKQQGKLKQMERFVTSMLDSTARRAMANGISEQELKALEADAISTAEAQYAKDTKAGSTHLAAVMNAWAGVVNQIQQGVNEIAAKKADEQAAAFDAAEEKSSAAEGAEPAEVPPPVSEAKPLPKLSDITKKLQTAGMTAVEVANIKADASLAADTAKQAMLDAGENESEASAAWQELYLTHLDQMSDAAVETKTAKLAKFGELQEKGDAAKKQFAASKDASGLSPEDLAHLVEPMMDAYESTKGAHASSGAEEEEAHAQGTVAGTAIGMTLLQSAQQQKLQQVTAAHVAAKLEAMQHGLKATELDEAANRAVDAAYAAETPDGADPGIATAGKCITATQAGTEAMQKLAERAKGKNEAAKSKFTADADQAMTAASEGNIPHNSYQALASEAAAAATGQGHQQGTAAHYEAQGKYLKANVSAALLEKELEAKASDAGISSQQFLAISSGALKTIDEEGHNGNSHEWVEAYQKLLKKSVNEAIQEKLQQQMEEEHTQEGLHAAQNYNPAIPDEEAAPEPSQSAPAAPQQPSGGTKGHYYQAQAKALLDKHLSGEQLEKPIHEFNTNALRELKKQAIAAVNALKQKALAAGMTPEDLKKLTDSAENVAQIAKQHAANNGTYGEKHTLTYHVAYNLTLHSLLTDFVKGKAGGEAAAPAAAQKPVGYVPTNSEHDDLTKAADASGFAALSTAKKNEIYKLADAADDAAESAAKAAGKTTHQAALAGSYAYHQAILKAVQEAQSEATPAAASAPAAAPEEITDENAKAKYQEYSQAIFDTLDKIADHPEANNWEYASSQEYGVAKDEALDAGKSLDVAKALGKQAKLAKLKELAGDLLTAPTADEEITGANAHQKYQEHQTAFIQAHHAASEQLGVDVADELNHEANDEYLQKVDHYTDQGKSMPVAKALAMKDKAAKFKELVADAQGASTPAAASTAPTAAPQTASASPAPSTPEHTAENILKTKVGALEGTNGGNGGGVYEGADGVKRYVKFYDDPGKATGEALANDLYSQLGIAAPNSQLFEHNGKLGHATPEIENEGTVKAHGLTKEVANKILDGFVADAFLANWDAVGSGVENPLANALVTKDGGVARIDQGGALLYKGLEGKKPADSLNKLEEWQKFADPSVNKQYAKVFQAAGLSGADDLKERAVDQIDTLLGVGDAWGGWKEWVKAHAPAQMSAADQTKIGEMLTKRAELLKEKRAELLAAGITEKKPVKEEFHDYPQLQGAGGAPAAGTPTFAFGQPNDQYQINGQSFKKLTEPEKTALFATPDKQLEGEPTNPVGTGNKPLSSGLVFLDPSGKVWVVHPKDSYGGYSGFTFPKGKKEANLSLQQNALKEAYEESGLKGEITGYLGKFEAQGSTGHYYLAKVAGGAPWDGDHESDTVKLVSLKDLKEQLTPDKTQDHQLLEAIKAHVGYQEPEGASKKEAIIAQAQAAAANHKDKAEYETKAVELKEKHAAFLAKLTEHFGGAPLGKQLYEKLQAAPHAVKQQLKQQAQEVLAKIPKAPQRTTPFGYIPKPGYTPLQHSEMMPWIEQHFAEAATKIEGKPAQKKAVQAYGGSAYDPMNDHLRFNQSATEGVKKYVKDLDKAMHHGSFSEDKVMWRGFGLSEEYAAGLAPGAVFKDDGFISTSMKHEFAVSWASGKSGQRIVAQINVPKGTPAVPTRIVPGTIESEYEITLPRGTSFKVSTVEKRKFKIGSTEHEMLFVTMDVHHAPLQGTGGD